MRPKTLRAWVAMRSILYSTLPHPLLRPVLYPHLPERVLDQMVVVEGVDLADQAAAQDQAAASASEVLRTSAGYY
jgi:hypothetical protein